MESNQLRALSGKLRDLADLARSRQTDPETVKVAQEKLDTVQVLNFIKFYGVR